MILGSDLNRDNVVLDDELRGNFLRLLSACNALELQYLKDGGVHLVVNSGVRSEEKQKEINPKCPQDAHTKAAAVDFADWDHKLYAYCEKNLWLLEKLSFYMESKDSAKNHTHLQLYPPKSGKRIFIA